MGTLSGVGKYYKVILRDNLGIVQLQDRDRGLAQNEIMATFKAGPHCTPGEVTVFPLEAAGPPKGIDLW